jgi:type IV pilus assembly protein PilM
MAFGHKKHAKRDQVIGLDIGTSQIKAAVLRRAGSRIQLVEYSVSPVKQVLGKSGTEQQFAAELQQWFGLLKVQERRVFVAISCASAMVCETEFPRMPIEEAKNALKLSSSRYLRRDFSNYYFDAVELVQFGQDTKTNKSSTMKVLVAGASKDEVRWYRDALLAAKIRPEAIELAAVTVVNAFQVANPALAEQEVALLVDIGANSTSINFVRHGQPTMTRIMHFGGAHINEYLVQILSLSAKAAEEEKLKMSERVQALVRMAVLPLCKEVRSSIDFFERQQECHVSKGFACGGTACATSILRLLSEEIGFSIESWNPIQSFGTENFNGEAPQLMAVAPALAAVVGVAAARF